MPRTAKQLWNSTSGCAGKVRIPPAVRREAVAIFPELSGLRGRAFLNALYTIAYCR